MAAEGIFAKNTGTERGLEKFTLAKLSFFGAQLFLLKKKKSV